LTKQMRVFLQAIWGGNLCNISVPTIKRRLLWAGCNFHVLF
jgi:hypothetical protein